jgi:cytochrome c-type biogenesis protein CcmH/NrfG
MSGNAKFRFLLAPILVGLFVVTSPVSWAGELEDAQEAVRQNPNDAFAHHKLGVSYEGLGQYKEAIASYKEAIGIKPDYPLRFVFGD